METVYQNCISLVVKTDCTSLLRIGYLKGRVTEVMHLHKEAEQLISEIITPPSYIAKPPKTITRRSVPLGFVGSLSRSLFGTLNMQDAEYFDKEIDRLYDYQRVITQIVKNQTHRVMSDLHHTHEIMEQLASKIDSNRLEINKLIEAQGAFKTLNYSLALIQYSNSVEISLNHYINGIQTFMTAIVAARQGELHPSLLSGPRLGIVMQEIRESVMGYELPMYVRRIEDLSKLTTVDLGYYNGKIIVTIHIPLIDRIKFELYHAYSWPSKQIINSNVTASAYLVPRARNIGLSTDLRTYFVVDDSFLNSCLKLHGHFLCQPETPLYEVQNSKSCELRLLLGTGSQEDTFQNCNIRMKSSHEQYWEKLKVSGAWLYSLDQTESLQIICNGRKSQIVIIEHSGILELHPDCTARTQTTTLTGVKIVQDKHYYYYQPDLRLNITELVPSLEEYTETHEVTKEHPGPMPWEVDTDNSLREVEEKLEIIGHQRREREHHLRLTYGSYLAQITVALLLVFYLSRTLIYNFIMRLRKFFIKQKYSPSEATREGNEHPLESLQMNRPPLPPQ